MQINDKAPEFTLANEDGEKVSLKIHFVVDAKSIHPFRRAVCEDNQLQPPIIFFCK